MTELFFVTVERWLCKKLNYLNLSEGVGIPMTDPSVFFLFKVGSETDGSHLDPPPPVVIR